MEFRDINAIKAFRSAITKAIRIYEKQQKATEEQMTKENKQEIKELYNQGMNPEEIAEELDLDECEVMDYCAQILEEGHT